MGDTKTEKMLRQAVEALERSNRYKESIIDTLKRRIGRLEERVARLEAENARLKTASPTEPRAPAKSKPRPRRAKPAKPDYLRLVDGDDP